MGEFLSKMLANALQRKRAQISSVSWTYFNFALANAVNSFLPAVCPELRAFFANSLCSFSENPIWEFASRKVFVLRIFFGLSSRFPAEYRLPKLRISASWRAKTRFHRSLPLMAIPARTLGASCPPLSSTNKKYAIFTYSLNCICFVAAFSNFASALRKISSTLPVGPLRCLAIIISATFCLTVSFSYWSGR